MILLILDLCGNYINLIKFCDILKARIRVFFMLFILVNVSDASAAGEAIMREGYYEDFKRAWIESLALAGDVCKFFL